MDYTLSLLTSNQWYLFYLAGVMIAAGYARDLRLFAPAYKLILSKVKSKRAVVAIISAIGGILPITGRVTISAGFLDTIAPKDKKKREVFGVIDYLSTHHYYLWSPLEKSVILPMAALSISYGVFMMTMLPLLITAFAVISYYIFYVLKEEDVEIDTTKFSNTSPKVFNLKFWEYINFGAVIMLAVVIVLSNIAKEYTDVIHAFVESGTASFALVSATAFLASLTLGSSSRFAAVTAICVSVYGIAYLPWFFAIDFAGYMLSPMHKCLVISKTYFGTPLKDYYKAICMLCGAIIVTALFTLVI